MRQILLPCVLLMPLALVALGRPAPAQTPSADDLAHRTIERNADGSVDLYFGPSAPAGKESNWVPTDANGRFEVLFRLYGPEKPFFEKTWVLPDIERVN